MHFKRNMAQSRNLLLMCRVGKFDSKNIQEFLTEIIKFFFSVLFFKCKSNRRAYRLLRLPGTTDGNRAKHFSGRFTIE